MQHLSTDQSNDCAHNTITFMRKKGIPPTPHNYTVWYHYHAGTFPDLKRALDILLDNIKEFTPALCAELYEKYFTTQLETVALSETAERIESELARVLSYLDKASEDTTRYGETLQTAGGEIENAEVGSDLRDTLAHLMRETHSMEQLNKDLQIKFQASSSEIVQLREELDDVRQEALTDSLTGLANRKMFDIEMVNATRDAMENGDALSLLMVDIDHFKKFNDTYGHQIGDMVLRLMASTLSKGIKGGDTAARYGGEEFAVILPFTDLQQAIKVAEGIRQRVSGKKLVNRQTSEDMGKLTVSIGVAEFRLGEPLTDFIRRADDGLYMAKRTGRDKVISEHELAAQSIAFD